MKQPRHSSWFNTTQHLINDHLELVIVAWNRGRESVLQTLQPTARKLWADMQMGGKARLLGNAASGHSTMGLKHTQQHPLSLIWPFFWTPDHSGGQKRQMTGVWADIAGAKLQARGFPWCQTSIRERKSRAVSQKHIMSWLKRLSMFWLRCKMYCHYCLFHSCLVVMENMQSNVGHVY